MTTALLMLRAKQIGLTIDELEEMEIGFVYDIFTEHANDNADYRQLATQEDFDKF